MSTRTASVILHGHRWPDPAWAQALRGVLAVPPGAGPASVVEVLEAREDPGRPRGAAAAIDAAASAAAGELLLVIEAGAAWDKRLVADLVSSVCAADVLAVAAPAPGGAERGAPPRAPAWNDAWIPAALPAGADLATLVQRGCAITLDEWARQLHDSRPRLWAVRRSTYRALAGLDAELWSTGFVEDLATRASARGVGVRVLAGPPAAQSAHDAWPLRRALREFLAIRGVLISAAQALPPPLAGRALAVAAALALRDAWRRARIAPERLAFGGTWGRSDGLLSRLRRTRGRDEPWPEDEGGAVLPLLAIDSFLDVLIARGTSRPHTRDVTVGSPASPQSDALASRTSGPAAVASGVAGPHARPPGTGTAPAVGPSDAAGVPDGSGAGTDAALPLVSVIVVNWNGREHLDACFGSILASDYPADRLDVLCVDNGSTDGSRELLASRFPAVRVVALAENRGFTGGNAAGVAAARGRVLAFFNNDMRVDPAAIRRLVVALDDECPCAAAEVRSWDGRRIDFVRGSANFEAHGFQDHYGEAWGPDRAAARETFFPNGGAFAITRDAYERAGGFDETYFAYYDDLDLGYGVRLNGGRVRMVHDALAFHRHGATSRKYPRGQKRFLMERNAVWTALKRYEPASLDRALGPILLLAARRIVQETVLRRGAPWVFTLAPFSSRCRRRAGAVPPVSLALAYDPAPHSPENEAHAVAPTTGVVAAMPVESLAAVGEALRGLPRVLAARRESESRRAVPDRLVFTEMGRPLAYGSPLASYQAAHDALVEWLRLAEVFRGRPRILVLTHEPLRARLSGPGIRVLELGRALSASTRVTIATPAAPEIADDRCAIVPYDPDRPASLRRLAEDADALLVQGFALTQFPFLAGMHVPIVADLYCPFTVEHLQMKAEDAHAHGAAAPDVDAHLEAMSILEVQNAQLRHGDFFICASGRQRDFWLGALHTAGRVNTHTYAADPTMRGLIDVVPFGVPEEDFDRAAAAARAAAGGPVLKGARAGIAPADKVLFWGGSLLDWQDPLTLIRAVARLARSRRDVKLFFAGTRHPNPQVAPMRIVDASLALARDLEVLDTHVFFNDWIPYEARAAFLQEADAGLSTHRWHLETHLSFRTRMLDYLWAALPIVCTEGDHFADLVGARQLGLVVPPGDEDALAAAIVRVIDDRAFAEACRGALRRTREELRWSRVCEPLRRFAVAPRFAADHEPAMHAIRSKLRRSYRGSKWVKRTALRLGVSEAGFEQLKSLPPVQAAIRLRNRLAVSRAGRLRG